MIQTIRIGHLLREAVDGRVGEDPPPGWRPDLLVTRALGHVPQPYPTNVEGFFAKLTKRRLKRGVFRSLVDLQTAVVGERRPGVEAGRHDCGSRRLHHQLQSAPAAVDIDLRQVGELLLADLPERPIPPVLQPEPHPQNHAAAACAGRPGAGGRHGGGAAGEPDHHGHHAAGETGHLVFATLHTQDAAQTIDRLRESLDKSVDRSMDKSVDRSIDKSIILSRLLNLAGLEHKVLNAHEVEKDEETAPPPGRVAHADGAGGIGRRVVTGRPEAGDEVPRRALHPEDGLR